MIKEGVPIDQLVEYGGNYLTKLKHHIGAETFRKILNLDADVTLMFVIDTTGSMEGEINAAKAIASSIAESMTNKNVDYILSPFNDPSELSPLPPTFFNLNAFTFFIHD